MAFEQYVSSEPGGVYPAAAIAALFERPFAHVAAQSAHPVTDQRRAS